MKPFWTNFAFVSSASHNRTSAKAFTFTAPDTCSSFQGGHHRASKYCFNVFSKHKNPGSYYP